ncbi:hypothetical protein Tco_0691222 [Tanacetum coccineum]
MLLQIPPSTDATSSCGAVRIEALPEGVEEDIPLNSCSISVTITLIEEMLFGISISLIYNIGAVVADCFKVKRVVVVESDNSGDCVRGHDWWCDGYGLSGEAVIIGAEQSIEVMAEIKAETTMDRFVTKDRADYYSRITRIMVNGKNAYELKGKFLEDLLSNAFSGTNKEDAVEHIKFFLKIVNLNNFPNVNYERIRFAIFPISLVEYAGKWFDEFKEFKEFNFLLKVDLELFTHDIERTKTYEDYENELNDELEEP